MYFAFFQSILKTHLLFIGWFHSALRLEYHDEMFILIIRSLHDRGHGPGCQRQRAQVLQKLLQSSRQKGLMLLLSQNVSFFNFSSYFVPHIQTRLLDY